MIALKKWTKLRLKDQNRVINQTAKALTNYLYSVGPIPEYMMRNQVSNKEKQEFKKFTADRVAGLLYLYFSKDSKRINDIVNRYSQNEEYEIFPELEGYIER